MNYALHNEVNGGILESGDFLHLKPEGAAAAGLKLGIAARTGEMEPRTGGCSVIQAEDGIATERRKAKKKHAR